MKQVVKMKKHSIASCCVILHMMMMMSFCEGVIKLPPNITIPAFFAFGDSIVDTGNNNALLTLFKVNFPPYGKEFNGGVPTGRFTNGKTPSDLIAEQLGIKDFIPAYLDPRLTDKDLPTGVSFASGGSGYDIETPQLASVIPLSLQLKYFKEYIARLKAAVGEPKANKILSNSLHLVVAGSNDLANTYFTFRFRQKQYDTAAYADLLVSSASTFVQELHKLGARKIAVFGAPPVGCLPAERTLSGGLLRVCNDEYNRAAQLYNSKLSPKLASLTRSLPQSRVVYIDIYQPLLDIILHPQKYGFDVSDRGCCGTGEVEAAILCNEFSGTCADDSKYVFWDSFHPTERTYKILVDEILKKYINFLM